MRTPTLCYVTDRHSLNAAGANSARALLDCVRAAASAGVDWIQLREKDLAARPLLDLTARAIAAARSAVAARVLVNDRLDVAWAAGAGGIHLGEHSLPAEQVVRGRHWKGLPDFLIGVSCHSPKAVQSAERAGADYVFFGPVFATPSKRAFGSPQGLDRLAAVARIARIPVLAIGGITAENAVACLDAGATGIAGIRLFQQNRSLADLLAKIR